MWLVKGSAVEDARTADKQISRCEELMYVLTSSPSSDAVYVDHHVTKALIGLGRFAGAVNDPTSQMAAACTACLVR